MVRQHLRRHSLEGLSVIRGRKVTQGFLKAGFGVTPLSLLIDPRGMPNEVWDFKTAADGHGVAG